ncbi:hypothetical protein J2T17_000189 [Paenibacillus mucilaginosus]|uniref:hypothetical protein n=1 Tax=Paenibacillus mucilaginosus TaxID=61624 RepID=UPI003D1C4A71
MGSKMWKLKAKGGITDMDPSNDKLIEEKMRGEKPSWAVPESPADTDMTSGPEEDNVPTNYENSLPSYNDQANFEVQKTPDRLG